jgi:transmembrane 9 superfamily member 2/4
LKKLETPRKKPIYKTQQTPEPDLKPGGFEFGCQISPVDSGSGAKFNPTIFFRGSGFRSTQPEPDPLPSLVIGENEQITFTYEVENVKSNIRCPSRWDVYMKMDGAKVHWFSIMNSMMVVFFLAGIVFVTFLRIVRMDLTRYEEMDKEAQAQMNEELLG